LFRDGVIKLITLPSGKVTIGHASDFLEIQMFPRQATDFLWVNLKPEPAHTDFLKVFFHFITSTDFIVVHHKLKAGNSDFLKVLIRNWYEMDFITVDHDVIPHETDFLSVLHRIIPDELDVMKLTLSMFDGVHEVRSGNRSRLESVTKYRQGIKVTIREWRN